jgi:hypothetical protein
MKIKNEVFSIPDRDQTGLFGLNEIIRKALG